MDTKAIAEKYAEMIFNETAVIYTQSEIERRVSQAITEATAGMWTDDDLLNAFTAGTDVELGPAPAFGVWLKQYKAQRGEG